MAKQIEVNINCDGIFCRKQKLNQERETQKKRGKEYQERIKINKYIITNLIL